MLSMSAAAIMIAVGRSSSGGRLSSIVDRSSSRTAASAS